jgi:hypothetical protein
MFINQNDWPLATNTCLIYEILVSPLFGLNYYLMELLMVNIGLKYSRRFII